MKRFFTAAILLALLIFLLCFPKNALEAARGGLLLWYQNVLPVLFPFMILSNLMIRTDLISVLLKYLHPLFHLIWGTSIYGSYAILAGYLFGYPMGAKVVCDLQKEGQLSDVEAEYLIGFVNNLSPAFLITYLVHQNLQNPDLLLPTLGVLYGAPLVTSMLFALKYRPLLHKSQSPTKAAADSVPQNSQHQKNKASKVPISLELIDACIFDGIINITRLGAYILLFSLITAGLGLLPIENVWLHCMLNGCMEITTGIQTTCQAPLAFFPKYLSLMALCSFGGLCALMQTLSVYPMKRTTRNHYLTSKFLTVCLSVLMTLSLFL